MNYDTNELYHHGVAGMKWGKRNGPPYPLNAEGKASLAKQKKASNRVSSGDTEGKAEPRSQKLDSKSKEDYKMHKEYNKQRAHNAVSNSKYKKMLLTSQEVKNAAEKGEAILNSSNQADTKKTKEKFNNPKEYLYDDRKLLGPTNYNSKADSDTKKRLKDAADLGLKALNKMGRDGYDEKTGITNSDRTWFIIEDQTIGLTGVADLVNRGASKSEILAIAKAADSREMDALSDSAWSIGEAYRQGKLNYYIDACLEVKKEQSKT